MLYVYSDPTRDPRKHTLSIVFTATSTDKAIAADDAEKAAYFDLNNLPTPIVFDHRQIINDFIAFQRNGNRPKPITFLK